MPRNRSRVEDIFTLLARNHTARAFKAHIRNSPVPPRITLYYNFSLFSAAFLLFLFLFGRSCGRQNSSSGSIYRNTSPLPARRPTNPFGRSHHTLHRSAMRRHPASARFSRPFRAPSAKSAAAFAAELPFDDPPRLFRSAPSIPASGAGERISLCSRFMWNIRLVIRQNLNIYRGFRSFMHIYTLRHCMSFACPFAFSVPAILSPLSLRG